MIMQGGWVKIPLLPNNVGKRAGQQGHTRGIGIYSSGQTYGDYYNVSNQHFNRLQKKLFLNDSKKNLFPQIPSLLLIPAIRSPFFRSHWFFHARGRA